ncbi:hypothetical protein PILCRDRAFT_61309, partial [Piloderma croceum F 1598]
TAQLIELEFQDRKLVDLEDVLDHVFCQGFVEAKYRPSFWWENMDGKKIKGGQVVWARVLDNRYLLSRHSFPSIIEDIPPAIWFSYNYKNNTSAPVVTQRIKFDAHVMLEKLAHVTNHIFSQGCPRS